MFIRALAALVTADAIDRAIRKQREQASRPPQGLPPGYYPPPPGAAAQEPARHDFPRR